MGPTKMETPKLEIIRSPELGLYFASAEVTGNEASRAGAAERELARTKLAQMKVMRSNSVSNLIRLSMHASARLKAACRAIVGRVTIRHAKSKALAVRETVALGDRRFVSVIEFERQRFLIGSSPSAITLLSILGDKQPRDEGIGETT
jgi:hypothetical protein